MVVATRAALESVDPDAPEVILVTLAGVNDGDGDGDGARFFASGIARLFFDPASSSPMATRRRAIAADSARRRKFQTGAGPEPHSSGARSTLCSSRVALALDPNVALLSDPSPHFSRDVDVEAASDGWDDVTAYGYDHVVDDPAMGWSRFCHGARVLTLDPGFVAMAPTREAARLAAMVAARAAARDRDARAEAEKDRPSSTSSDAKSSDADFEHLVFNEALHLPSHGSYASPGATRRALYYLCFANTKALFRFVRKDARWREPAEHVPVAVRASYHPNEPERLEDVYAYYVERKPGAVRAWADGTGRAEDGG